MGKCSYCHRDNQGSMCEKCVEEMDKELILVKDELARVKKELEDARNEFGVER